MFRITPAVSAVVVLREQAASSVSAFTGSILAFYVSTDWFFITGFITFQLAVACALFNYRWFLKLHR